MLVPFLMLVASQQVAATVVDYVPDVGWSDDKWAKEFYERWFGDQLRAMQEPPLSEVDDLSGFRERFRLLILPTFEPAYAYRIDVQQDESASLRWARLTGRGGYDPGTLARQGTRKLRRSEVDRFNSALESAALNSLARKESDGVVTNSDGTGTISICLDGTTFVFEHLSSSGRQFVMRSCDIDENPLRLLADEIVRLKSRRAMD